MQREIKFKVWDNDYKEFSNWTNRDPHFDVSNGKLFFWERVRKEDGSYDGDIILEDLGSRFVLLQYTGLKDLNGEKIYEGDIIKYYTNGFTTEHVDEVFYDVKHGQLNPTIENYTVVGEHCEIIGNIFENPELLNQ